MSIGATKSESTTQRKTPEQTAWLGQALEEYGPTLGQGEDVFAGTRVAPLTPTQTQATDVQGFLKQFAPYRDMPMFGETGTALSGVLSGTTGAAPITPEATEQFYKRTIEDPAAARWEESIKPGIREEFAGPGFWGSARPRAVTKAGTDLSNWLGTQRGQLEWDVGQANRQIEEAKAGRSLAAIQPGMQYGQTPTQEAQARLTGRGEVLGLSTVQQQQQQAEINAAIQTFAEENRLTSEEDMQILMALLGLDFTTGTSLGRGFNVGLPQSAG